MRSVFIAILMLAGLGYLILDHESRIVHEVHAHA